MYIGERIARDREMAEFLCTIIERKPNGKPRYPSIVEAAAKYRLHPSQAQRIKLRLIGKDRNGERKLNDG